MCTTIVSVGELFSVVTPIWRPHTTCGGDTSGYSEIGNLNSAISPTRNTMIDSTAAKRGRSMKKWETSMVRRLKPLWLSGGHRRLLADRHAHAVDQRPQLDFSELRLVVLPDDQHEFLALIGADRVLGCQHRRVRAASHQPDPRKKPGRKAPLGIVEYRAPAHRAGLRVQAVVDEVHHAAVREPFLVGQPHRHRTGIRS